MHELFKNEHPTVYAQIVTLATFLQYVGSVATTTGVVELAQVPIIMISIIEHIIIFLYLKLSM